MHRFCRGEADAHGFQAIAAGGDGWGVVADGIKERAEDHRERILEPCEEVADQSVLLQPVVLADRQRVFHFVARHQVAQIISIILWI